MYFFYAMSRSAEDAPFDVRAFDRIDLVGEEDDDDSNGISESVIFSETGGNNCSGMMIHSPHFKGGPSLTSLNGSVVHHRDDFLSNIVEK